jgi:hypothetical protein
MSNERKLGGIHPARFEHGCIHIDYVGEVDAQAARDLLDAATAWSTGAHSVWISDISQLGSFTPEARKVLSSMGGDQTVGETHVHTYFVGASIKTKAVLSLVFAATRLMGRLRYHVTYCDELDEARAKGHAKYDELATAGLVPPL